MSTAPKPVAATILKWLRDNGLSLGVLTGTDARALRAAVQIVDLYSATGSLAVVQAFGSCVKEMQPSARHLAFHAVAHVLDWDDRAKLWAARHDSGMRLRAGGAPRMIHALAIAVVLLLGACVYFMRVGCRSIVALSAALERERKVCHPLTGVPRRPTPAWLRRART